jgi:hypothetical protein
MTSKRKPAAYSEVVTYWRGIRSTLAQRGLLRQKREDGSRVVPETQALILPKRVVFLLDMNRLAGIAREKWLDRDLWLQIRAALQGRRTYVADSAGLAVVVAREPGQRERKRLPKVIPLTPEELPKGRYTVTLGHDRDGPVILDLAGNHRAILTGGASGGGKTNGMQAILAQLAMKHNRDAVQLAIVDTKEVDFSSWCGLPHLFAPVAHTIEDAGELIDAVEQERRRRKAVMVKAGVKEWRQLPEPFPLLVLTVDEAADFTGTAAMDTLTQVARKGRSFGVSVMVGTQYPTSKVIDPQVKANLPQAIAFRCRTQNESRVILDRGGAETLSRPGLAMTYIGGAWRTVQVLHVEQGLIDALGDETQETEPEARQVLGDDEAMLVAYAVNELGGAFKVDPLYDAMKGQMSRRQIVQTGRDWERRGWLTEPQRNEHGHPIGRQVTPELRELAGADAREHTPAHEDPTPSGESGKAGKAVQRASEGERGRQSAGKAAVRRPESDVENETGLTPAVTPSDDQFCPVLACKWNNDGRGVCDYAIRGLRCGDPQWRDEWREAMDNSD